MLHQCNIWWVTAIWIKPSGRKGLWTLFPYLAVGEKNNLAKSVTFFQCSCWGDVMFISSESRIDADFIDFADFWGPLCIQRSLLSIAFPIR